MKTGHKSMFNSLPRSFNCLRTESADVCSLNGRTIRTDYRSDVELRGDAGVFFFFLLYSHHLQCSTYITYTTYINKDTYLHYVTLQCLTLLLEKKKKKNLQILSCLNLFKKKKIIFTTYVPILTSFNFFLF